MDWMWTKSVISLLQLSGQIPPGSCLNVYRGMSTICGKRNALAEECLRHPQLKWLLFVDSDMTTPPDVIQQLLAHDADIVAGLCCQRHAPDECEAGRVLAIGDSTDPLRPGDSSSMQYQLLAPSMAGKGAVSVDMVGTGVMLIRRHVLEKMPPPWFVANERHYSGHNEDFNFCLRARDLGFSILCDTSVVCGHVGSTEITPENAASWQATHEENA